MCLTLVLADDVPASVTQRMAGVMALYHITPIMRSARRLRTVGLFGEESHGEHKKKGKDKDEEAHHSRHHDEVYAHERKLALAFGGTHALVGALLAVTAFGLNEGWVVEESY